MSKIKLKIHYEPIKIEGTSKFQIGEICNNTIHNDFEKIKTFLNIKGHLMFGDNFKR